MEEILKEIFGNITVKKGEDNFAFYELKFICNEPDKLLENINEDKYTLLNKIYDKYNYSWDLTIGSYSISQNKFDKFSNDFEEEELEVDYKIHKNENKIVFFNEKYFSKYLNTLTLEGLLTLLGRRKNNDLSFFEKYSTNIFWNDYIGYNYSGDIIQKTITVISVQCNFRNSFRS